MLSTAFHIVVLSVVSVAGKKINIQIIKMLDFIKKYIVHQLFR
jgi:hypothetical protein